MRVEDGIYFSPNLKYYDIDFNHPDSLVEAFRDRIKQYYIEPIKKLNDDHDAFAAGLICVTTIDVLSRLKYDIDEVRKRYVGWLISEIPDFGLPGLKNKEQKVADLFYRQFRNGLVHEGRIKDGGQFSYLFGDLITLEDSFMVINPRQLVEKIEIAFDKYIFDVLSKPEELQKLLKIIEQDFGADIAQAKRF
ncbi:hypothetical protein ACFFK0_18470 [Paenibacillus chartarius]|uniref:Apea-like HEPN domain-containing protein n=1 Tax=Paenibacillus chartarius TaxID=747481 RepID=A0ABV6DP41_9BACL